MRLASLCYAALKGAGVTTLARQLSGGGVILCYHNVVPGNDAHPWDTLGLHMPLLTFERQIQWLADNYAVVSLEELVGRLSGGRSVRGVAAITFDDGYSGVFEHAWPLLRELSIPATVFVVAGAPGRNEGFWWDDPDVLRAYSPERRERWLTTLCGDSATIVGSLAHASRPPSPSFAPRQPLPSCRPAAWQTITHAVGSGLRLGVHSATHRSLPALDELDLRREIVESRDIIRRYTGVTAEFFAYPYGLWNDRVQRAVRSAGYRAACTLEYGHNSAPADLWALRRVSVPAGIEDAAFQAWTAGLSLRRRNGS